MLHIAPMENLMLRKMTILAAASVVLAGCDGEIGGENGGDISTPNIGFVCRSAVAGEANVSIVETSAGAILTTSSGYQMDVLLTGAEAPWLCFTDFSGIVSSVEFTQEG